MWLLTQGCVRSVCLVPPLLKDLGHKKGLCFILSANLSAYSGCCFHLIWSIVAPDFFIDSSGIPKSIDVKQSIHSGSWIIIFSQLIQVTSFNWDGLSHFQLG